MNLYLDTTRKITEIKLFSKEGFLKDQVSFDGSFILSDELIEKIDKLLEENRLSKKDIKAIAVNVGPGSYTGVRIGVTTANLLAFSMNIPIVKVADGEDVEKKLKEAAQESIFGSPVLPIYKEAPHITSKK